MFQKTKFTLTNGAGDGSPSYSGFDFGCAKEPKDGKIQLVSGTHSCREGLFHNMRTRICNSGDVQPTDKMRMIFRWYVSSASNKSQMEADDEWAKRSVAVLQAFDKTAGWPLTRVYKLGVGSRNWLQAYYYYSSRRWMKSSYLVSLYVLLVRMCKDKRITGFKDFDGLVKVVQKALSSGQNLTSDHSYVKPCLPYWEAIMKGYPDLFRKHKMPYYWDTARLSGGSGGGSEGIQYLISGTTKYTEIREELLRIKKELDGKKSK